MICLLVCWSSVVQEVPKKSPAPTLPASNNFKCSLLSILLSVTFFHFIYNIVGRSPGECQDRPGRALISLRYSTTRVDHKQVFAVMCLGILIQHGCRRIISHSCGSYFMNNSSGCMQPILRLQARLAPNQDSTHGCKNLFKCFVHMFRLQNLMVTPCIIKAQYRNAILIYHVRIDLTIVIVPCNTFSAAGNPHCGSPHFSDILFQTLSIAAIG